MPSKVRNKLLHLASPGTQNRCTWCAAPTYLISDPKFFCEPIPFESYIVECVGTNSQFALSNPCKNICTNKERGRDIVTSPGADSFRFLLLHYYYSRVNRGLPPLPRADLLIIQGNKRMALRGREMSKFSSSPWIRRQEASFSLSSTPGMPPTLHVGNMWLWAHGPGRAEAQGTETKCYSGYNYC